MGDEISERRVDLAGEIKDRSIGAAGLGGVGSIVDEELDDGSRSGADSKVERGVAGSSLDVDLGVVFEEPFDRLDVAVHAGLMKGCDSALGRIVDHDAFHVETVEDVEVSVELVALELVAHEIMEGSCSIVGGHIDTRSMAVQEDQEDVKVALRGGAVKRSPSVFISSVDTETLNDQVEDLVETVFIGGHVQGGLSDAVFEDQSGGRVADRSVVFLVAEVDVKVADEDHDFLVCLLGQGQRRKSSPRFNVPISAVLEEKLEDLFVSKTDSIMKRSFTGEVETVCVGAVGDEDSGGLDVVSLDGLMERSLTELSLDLILDALAVEDRHDREPLGLLTDIV